METINATELKAKCLAILDRVKETGESVLILKRGRPVARLVPPTHESEKHPQNKLRGTVRILGDIVEPVLPPEAWDATRRR